MRFKDKIALVTGSGRGIGRAVALLFAREGAHVIVNFFRNRKPAEETAVACRAYGGRVHLVKANVGDLDDLARLYREIGKVFGGLDIVVNNAASGYNRPVLEQKPKGWDWTLNINARAILFGAQYALPLMQARQGGYIVSLSSLGSVRVLPDYVLVGVSKAAVETLTRYLAVELAPHNIVVNAVSAGIVATEALEHFRVLKEVDVLQYSRDRTPAGRLVEPEDIAQVIAFLCTPAASMIRGQTIVVDGGYSLLAW